MINDALNDSSDEGKIDLLPFYVYELRDPRDNSVFYVGKGKNNRINHHDADDDDVYDELSAKEQKIRDIRDAGHLDPLRIVVARFSTENEAFAAECILIKWVYGLGNLTNRIHGHRHHNMRDHSEQVAKTYPVIPGIDIRRNLPGYGNSGEYTEQQRKAISDNCIFEKLQSLRLSLQQQPSFQHLTFSDPDFSKPQDPCILVSGFHPNNAVQLQIKMQLSGSRVVLNLIPMSRDSENIKLFKEATTSSIDHGFSLRKGNRYGVYTQTHDFVSKNGGFPGGLPYENVDLISKFMSDTLSRLRSNDSV